MQGTASERVVQFFMSFFEILRVGRVMVVIADEDIALGIFETFNHNVFRFRAARKSEIYVIVTRTLGNEFLIRIIGTGRAPALRYRRAVIENFLFTIKLFVSADFAFLIEAERQFSYAAVQGQVQNIIARFAAFKSKFALANVQAAVNIRYEIAYKRRFAVVVLRQRKARRTYKRHMIHKAFVAYLGVEFYFFESVENAILIPAPQPLPHKTPALTFSATA